MRTEDYTLTMLLTIFDRARLYNKPLEITPEHIKIGDFIWYHNPYRFDESLLPFLLEFERYSEREQMNLENNK